MTIADIQNMYHRSPCHRSFHHCHSDFGSDSLNIVLRITSRSHQYLKLLICRCSALRVPHFHAVGSRKYLSFFFKNHFFVVLSDSGKRSTNVHNISLMKSSSKMSLHDGLVKVLWKWYKLVLEVWTLWTNMIILIVMYNIILYKDSWIEECMKQYNTFSEMSRTKFEAFWIAIDLHES